MRDGLHVRVRRHGPDNDLPRRHVHRRLRNSIPHLRYLPDRVQPGHLRRHPVQPGDVRDLPDAMQSKHVPDHLHVPDPVQAGDVRDLPHPVQPGHLQHVRDQVHAHVSHLRHV